VMVMGAPSSCIVQDDEAPAFRAVLVGNGQRLSSIENAHEVFHWPSVSFLAPVA
jgi:hypothetical protein